MAVVPDEQGKHAVTHYKTLESHGHTSVVTFRLETGRTHQIRVHSSHRNQPVLGDPKYGGRSIRFGPHTAARQTFFGRIFDILSHPALHAYRLGFTHPSTGETLHFEAEPPSVWKQVAERLRNASW